MRKTSHDKHHGDNRDILFVIGSAVSYIAVAASLPLAGGKPSIRELNHSGKTLLLHVAGYLIDWTPRRLQPDRLAR